MDVKKIFSILSLFQIRWVVESAKARINIYSSTKSWKIPIGNGTYYAYIVTNERHLVSWNNSV
jgi:hypothetical protein